MALDSQPRKTLQGPSVDPKDVEIATRMGIKLLEEGGGMDVIKKGIEESQDPTQVIGQFLAQLVAQLAEQLQGELGVDPKVFLARDGFLMNILDYIESKLGLPPEFSEQVGPQVIEIITAAAKNPDAKRGPNALPPDQQMQAAQMGQQQAPAPAGPPPQLGMQ